ncbi:hypothetical protein GCM10010245_92000 [Streptomyces spectabilis]|nr:hypothetical protein GCM10010245_92000 [Streptomyces spectabilis]
MQVGGHVVTWQSPLSLAVWISLDTGDKGLCWFATDPPADARSLVSGVGS